MRVLVVCVFCLATLLQAPLSLAQSQPLISSQQLPSPIIGAEIPLSELGNQSFTVEVPSGNGVWLRIDQLGVDVICELTRPDNSTLESDQPAEWLGAEWLAFGEAGAGTYTLEVLLKHERPLPGSIRITGYQVPLHASDSEFELIKQWHKVGQIHRRGEKKEREEGGLETLSLIIETLERLHRPADHAMARWHRGVMLFELGRYADAVSDYSEAIRLWKESGDQLSALSVTSSSLLNDMFLELSNRHAGKDASGSVGTFETRLNTIVDELLTAIAEASNFSDMPEFQGAALLGGVKTDLQNNLCLAYTYNSRFDDAERCFPMLKQLAMTEGNSSQEATALNNSGGILYSQNRIPESLPYFEQARDLYLRYNLLHLTQSAFNNVALANSRMGYTREAIGNYHQALAALEHGGSEAKHVDILVNTAHLYGRLGDYKTMESFTLQALSAMKNLGTTRSSVHKSLAIALNGLDRLDEAEAQFELAFESIRDDKEKLTLELAKAVAQINSDYRVSQSRASKLLNEAVLAGDRLLIAHANYVVGAVLLEEKPQNAVSEREALKSLGTAAAEYKSLAFPSGELRALSLSAEANIRLNQPGQAERLFEEAASVISNIQTQIDAIHIAPHFARTSREFYQKWIDFILSNGVGDVSQVQIQRAVDITTLYRAWLHQYFKIANQSVRGDKDYNEKVIDFHVAISKRQKLLQENQFTKAEGFLVQIKTLAQAIESLDDKVLGDQLSTGEPISSNEVGITLFAGEKQYYAMVNVSNELTLRTLPRDETDATLESLKESWSKPSILVDRRSQRRSEKLLKKLLGDVSSYIEMGVDTLHIVPDGVFNEVPLSAFSFVDRNDRVSYLIEAMTVLEHSIRLETARREPVSLSRMSVVADPVFNKNDDRVKNGSILGTESHSLLSTTSQTSGWGSSLPRLQGSRKELAAIKTVFPGTINEAVGLDANFEILLNSNFLETDILHLATHARTTPKDVYKSGFYLSYLDKQGEEIDNFVSTAVIPYLKLNTDLVVLSACDTGTASGFDRYGTLNLSAMLISAGSSAVISTSWTVSDRTSEQAMRSFYQRLKDSEGDMVDSLREMQLELLANSKYRIPYYWAGYRLSF